MTISAHPKSEQAPYTFLGQIGIDKNMRINGGKTMSDESTKKYTDAYNVFASIVGIEPKDYNIFQVSRDGDTLTIRPGWAGLSMCPCEMATHIDLDSCWDEVDWANSESKEARILALKELIDDCIAEALR